MGVNKYWCAIKILLSNCFENLTCEVEVGAGGSNHQLARPWPQWRERERERDMDGWITIMTAAHRRCSLFSAFVV